MTLSTNQGATAVVQSSWSVGGVPTDVSNLTVAVSAVSDGSPVVSPTASGIYHASTGEYTFSWAVPTTQAVGDYLATWSGTLAGVASTQQVVVTVQDTNFGFPSFLTWCDISLTEGPMDNRGTIHAVDPVAWVKSVTGQTLTMDSINQGQQVLNLYSNYTPESSGFNMQPFDLLWLRYGLAYQSTWMTQQPGLLYRAGVTSISQDGLSTNFADARAIMLAPLAVRALKQLSWQKSRSLRVRVPFIDDQTPMSSDPDAEANDLYERWVDMYNFGYRGSSVP